MVDWHHIIKLLNLKPKQLRIYGDVNQIGNVDMIQTGGDRQ